METLREVTEQKAPEIIESPGFDAMVDREPVSPSLATLAANRAGVGRVARDLDRFGPDQAIPRMAVDEAITYCLNLARSHYENFSVVTRLVPRELRPHFASVYAYCRWSDDLADESGSPERASALLTWWRRQLDECFTGRASHPVFMALNHTRASYPIQHEPFADLLSAFQQDQSVNVYANDEQLHDYCRRSANPVGRIVLSLAQVTDPKAIAMSDRVCTALQLVNFLQDIPIDARRGRVYWPEERRTKHQVSTSDCMKPTDLPRACDGVRDWAKEVHPMFLDGAPLLKFGPKWLARSVQLFISGGLTLLTNIESAHGDVWSTPLTVTRGQKLRLLARALLFPRTLPNHLRMRSADIHE